MSVFGRLVIVALIGLLASETAVAEHLDRALQSIEMVTGNEAGGGRVIGGTAVSSNIVNSPDGSATVTVSTYDNDGLWDRLKKLWFKILDHEDNLLPGVGARHGDVGGTVTFTDENGGGTVKITVYNNATLLQRVIKLSGLVIQHEFARLQRKQE